MQSRIDTSSESRRMACRCRRKAKNEGIQCVAWRGREDKVDLVGLRGLPPGERLSGSRVE